MHSLFTKKIIKYALLTKNFILGVAFQITESSGRVELIGISRMVSTSCEKKYRLDHLNLRLPTVTIDQLTYTCMFLQQI